MSTHKPLDYWKWAASEDVVSLDSYPDTSDPDWMVLSGAACDLMRSLGHGRPWLLMEQAPTHVNWRQRNATKRPGVMRLGSYQAMARGADGIMFFQWRASQAGSEKFHSGMLPHAGTDTRVWREVKALGAELGKLDALRSSRVLSEVAILFDWENWWALEQGSMPSNSLKLLPRVIAFYAELFRRHITVDFAYPGDDLSKYRLVIAPHLYLVDDRSAANIEKYVADGGTLLTTFFSGIVDPQDHVRLGGYPAPFRKLLGLWVEEFAAYGDEHTGRVLSLDEDEFACSLWSEVIRLEGAEVLAQYLDDYVAGGPAITRHSFGRGSAFYLGTELARPGLAWLIDQVCSRAGVRPDEDLPPGLEITRRTDGSLTWLFALNHGDRPAAFKLPSPGLDLLSGEQLSGKLNLAPQAVAIIQLQV